MTQASLIPRQAHHLSIAVSSVLVCFLFFVLFLVQFSLVWFVFCFCFCFLFSVLTSPLPLAPFLPPPPPTFSLFHLYFLPFSFAFFCFADVRSSFVAHTRDSRQDTNAHEIPEGDIPLPRRRHLHAWSVQ